MTMVTAAPRFSFGRNWRRYLEIVDEDRIAEAERSLVELFGPTLDGKAFLDVGSGSGLFSLAARRLGARVVSFDADPESVECTRRIGDKFGEVGNDWRVEYGSVLDRDFLYQLGRFDIVYAFGVVHHTGKMWEAINRVLDCVAPDGRVFLGIYNDCGEESARWAQIKRRYNELPTPLRLPYAIAVWLPHEYRDFRHYVATQGLAGYIRVWTKYKETSRGMSRWHDIIDWVGGFPYETASRDAVIAHLGASGFSLETLIANDGTGCNQFLFRRTDDSGTGE